MSRLEELINELCPDGVEYKKMGDVIKFLNGRAYKKTELLDDGKYRVLRVGNFFTSDRWYYSDLELDDDKYCNNGDLLYAWAASLGPMIWDGDKTIFHYHIWKLRFDENVLLKRYLFHFLTMDTQQIYGSLTESTMPHVSMENMMKREVPVPPLEVQREIVRVLDKFTLLRQELSAELSARRKQYEYYRDELIENADGEMGKLIDLLSQPITDGPHTTPKLVEEGVPFISATALYDGAIHLENAQGFISKEFDAECAKKYKPRRNDIYMVKSGSTTGKVAFVDTDTDFNIWSPLAAMRTDNYITARYVYHVLQTSWVQFLVQTRMSHGSQPNLSMRVLEQFDIKVPTLKEQEIIITVLDRFDILCNDISSGLPAEIEARTKQYEYYRDKLLSFKRKETA